MFFLPYRSKKSLGHLCPCTFKQVSEINSLYNNKKWGTLQCNFYTIIHFFVQIEGSKLFSNVVEIYTVNLAFWMADLSRVVENVSNLYFLSLLNLATKNWWKYDLKVYGSYKLTWVAGSIVMALVLSWHQIRKGNLPPNLHATPPPKINSFFLLILPATQAIVTYKACRDLHFSGWNIHVLHISFNLVYKNRQDVVSVSYWYSFVKEKQIRKQEQEPKECLLM